MNQQELATCHCIISHPSKPKFLVIRHDDRWSPPMFGLPAPGPMSGKTSMINDNLWEKYGLRTRVLRHWVSLPNYHCVEVELQPDGWTRRLDAVWVGRQEYAKFRSSKAGGFDPLEAWLEEAEAGGPGPQRPWERPGWFQRAGQWAQHELDQQNIQVTGSVEQFTAFRLTACLLRVPAAEGHFYLKASTRQAPPEAILTAALAQRWPEYVPAPVAVNERENWMLNRDYRASGEPVRYEDYPEIARGLAALQVESMSSLVDWRGLACPDLTSADLEHFLADRDRLAGILAEHGDDPLTEQEFSAFVERIPGWQAACRELASSPVPKALLHNDLWYPNLYRHAEGFWLTDWFGTMLGHPFFSVLKLLRFQGLWQEGQPPLPESDEKCEALREEVIEAYLASFREFDSEQGLRRSLDLAVLLEGPWRLFRWTRNAEFEEAGKFPYQRIARTMRRIARELIA
jgi:hypothetical protein